MTSLRLREVGGKPSLVCPSGFVIFRETLSRVLDVVAPGQVSTTSTRNIEFCQGITTWRIRQNQSHRSLSRAWQESPERLGSRVGRPARPYPLRRERAWILAYEPTTLTSAPPSLESTTAPPRKIKEHPFSYQHQRMSRITSPRLSGNGRPSVSRNSVCGEWPRQWKMVAARSSGPTFPSRG